jgi:hypothetical protein
MAFSKAAKAAPVATGGDLRSIERFGGRLDLHATTKTSLQVQHLIRRFGLPPATAGTIATLAFDTDEGRRA